MLRDNISATEFDPEGLAKQIRTGSFFDRVWNDRGVIELVNLTFPKGEVRANPYIRGQKVCQYHQHLDSMPEEMNQVSHFKALPDRSEPR